jgi:hypothetical protein
MSKEILDKAYMTNLEAATKLMELYKDNAEEAVKAWTENMPTMYTPEEIKKNAETLYDFIMKKDS